MRPKDKDIEDLAIFVIERWNKHATKSNVHSVKERLLAVSIILCLVKSSLIYWLRWTGGGFSSRLKHNTSDKAMP